MTKIEHPSMRRRSNAEPAQQQHRVATVVDAEAEAVLFEKEMEEVELSVQSQPTVDMNEVLNDPVMEKQEERRKAFEKITLFRQAFTKDVVIKDSTFVLKILNANDNDAIFERVMELTENEQITRTPVMILAASLVSVNGIKVEELYEGEPTDDVLYKKYHEISRWPSPLTKSLTRAYNDFSESMEKEFTVPFLDKSPKTDTTE